MGSITKITGLLILAGGLYYGQGKYSDFYMGDHVEITNVEHRFKIDFEPVKAKFQHVTTSLKETWEDFQTKRQIKKTVEKTRTVEPPTLPKRNIRVAERKIPAARISHASVPPPEPPAQPVFRRIASYEAVGSQRRFIFEDWKRKSEPIPIEAHSAPDSHDTEIPSSMFPPSSAVAPKPEQQEQVDPPSAPTEIYLGGLRIDHPETQSELPLQIEIEDVRLIERVAEIADNSPLQPGSRSCGHNRLNSSGSANKVKSIGYERRLSRRIDLELEYIYQDECYQKAVAPVIPKNLPSDDGVKLRVNMRF